MNIFNLIELHTFLIVCEILILIVVVRMVAEKQKPTSMMAWLLAIILIPYVAVPFYFIFGIRKRKRKRHKSASNLRKINHVDSFDPYTIRTVLVNQEIPTPTSNNHFELYLNGMDAYDSLINHIHQTKKSIYISTYVFQKDHVTLRLLAALTEKAQKGVTVKLLIDSLGSYRVYFNQRIFKRLRKAGGKVCFFMPIIQMPFRNYINFRNHRKIYLFDKHSVLTGGMNLGDEYMGPTPCHKRWDDILFKIEGHAVCHFHNLFASDWEYAAKEHIPDMTEVFRKKTYGKNLIQVVPSGPDIPNDALYESLIAGIYAAQTRIWIVTPYFVPSDSLLEALQIAYYRGVDVKLITPKVSNHLIADLARSNFMRQLVKTGIEIALFNKKMIHAKAVLFDDKAVMLGSVNLDNRSLFLNYEVVTYAYEPSIIEQVDRWMSEFLKDADNKLPIPTRTRKLGENMVKLLAPLL
ncbi:phospholipase D-like domain-containing protein [Caedibacter taeniospiralis]|uniref:phospholipase D-like domain-containing protein n=1 Tax=Caedibacter taeniospiralis TaxID=28907 RepID=UPI001302B31A|nr:phospholipase D-like domain-containing protein [Caedibacter taeniospiralis]